jgi:hypothetical protein
VVASGRERCAITPATKVAELLASWPELEPVLVAQAPAFRRLKNPAAADRLRLPAGPAG